MSTETFLFENEDHTLGNIVRMRLLENDSVTFAAYKIPHPLDNKLLIIVQSEDPKESLQESIKNIKTEVSQLQKSFQLQVKKLKN